MIVLASATEVKKAGSNFISPIDIRFGVVSSKIPLSDLQEIVPSIDGTSVTPNRTVI